LRGRGVARYIVRQYFVHKKIRNLVSKLLLLLSEEAPLYLKNKNLKADKLYRS